MADLYENLENYHDEKIIDELRCENNELKTKLEEYSSVITRLQKDFDELNSEYKKLEIHYASLLKTARAEIERKAEMIKSLNTEKDLLVIKALQTSNRNILTARRYNMPKGLLSNSRNGNETDIKGAVKPQTEPQATNKSKVNRNKDDRINSTHTQSELPASSDNNKFREEMEFKGIKDTQSENTISTLDNRYIREEKELKDTKNDFGTISNKSEETVANNIDRDISIKYKGAKIFNRRKSMPCKNLEPIYSSEDDFEALNLKNNRKSTLREDVRHFDKNRSRDNCTNRDKFYSSITNRSADRSKYTHDSYESSSRYTRHSPNKYHSKYTNEHSGSHRPRADNKNNRQRILRSPLNDKYNHSRNKDRRNFDRENYYDRQRLSPDNSKNSAAKHKTRIEFDEPSTKRQKTDSYKKSPIEENTYSNEREKEYVLRGSFTNKQDLMEPTSCQSPDYANVESTTPHHVVKEIKHTALTHLEDPRVLSKKYTRKSSKEKTILTTVVSEDVDIEPVDVSSWNLPNKNKFMIQSMVPVKQVSEVTDKDFVNKVYIDTVKPLLNDSLESGEIDSVIDDDCCIKDSDVNKMYANKEFNKDYSKALSNSTIPDCVQLKIPATNKYKIPKIKNPDKISTVEKHKDFDTLSKGKKSATNHNENKKNEVGNQTNIKTLPQPTSTSQIKSITIDKQHNDNETSKQTAVLSEKTLSDLADDLELSDEGTESKDVIENNSKQIKRFPSKVNPSKDSVTLTKNKYDMPLVNDVIQNSEPQEKSKSLSTNKATGDSVRDKGKNRKNKKKAEVKVATCTGTKVENKELPQVSKFNSEPVISIETKNKFNDLFGDSSSLITPDDLGLLSPNIQLLLPDKYNSIFDNTQDAVDLSVKDITVVEPEAGNSSTFKNQLNNQPVVDIAENYGKKPLLSINVDINQAANDFAENKLCKENVINSNLVKTVVISTGVQPNYTPESTTLQSIQENGIDKLNNNKANLQLCNMMNSIQALATSTPHKSEGTVSGLSATILDPGANDARKVSDNTNISSLNVSNASNADVTVNGADVPDVRLFLKRRRKIIKKP